MSETDLPTQKTIKFYMCTELFIHYYNGKIYIWRGTTGQFCRHNAIHMLIGEKKPGAGNLDGKFLWDWLDFMG